MEKITDEQLLVSIRLGEKTVVRKLAVKIQYRASETGHREWHGRANYNWVAAVLKVGQAYDLVTVDGRQGPVVFSKIIGFWPPSLTFRGLGTLE